MSPPPFARRLALALASAVVFPVLIEVGLRLVGFDYPPYEPRIVLWGGRNEEGLRAADGLHRASRTQLWEPNPGAEVPFGEPRDRINARGYRGPELPLARRPGTIRIATLGDSSSFGHSVRWDQCYSAQLLDLCRQRGLSAEVLTAGVIGFTIRQGIERYRELVRPYHPDLVIAAFGAVNEHMRCIGLPDREKIRLWKQHETPWRQALRWARRELRVLHLAGWVADHLGDDRRQRFERHRKQWALQQAAEEEVGQPDWDGVRRVSPAEFRAALSELRDDVVRDGARLVVVSMPRHPQKEERLPVLLTYTRVLEEWARAEGVPLVDFRAAVQARLAQGQRWEELFADHYHPGPAGHRLLARLLAEQVLRWYGRS